MNTSQANTYIQPNGSHVTAPQLPWVYEVETHRIIELEAYLRAEGDGFTASPYEYWLLAEKEFGCSDT